MSSSLRFPKRLIDVGGTTTHIYLYNSHSCKYELTTSLLTDVYNIDKFIFMVCADSCSSSLLGLPGDVSSALDGRVFCPPLNCHIDVNKLKDLEIHVVNDMIIESIVFLAENRSVIDHHELNIVANLGTSVGLSTLPQTNKISSDFTQIKSYEFAHESSAIVGHFSPLYKQITRKINTDCQNFSIIYSMGGLACYLDLPVKVDYGNMLRVERNSFAEAVVKKQIDPDNLSYYLSCFKRDVMLYLNIKPDYKSLSFNIRGGFFSAFSASKYYQNIINRALYS